MNQFEVGQVVVLKSGGPAMTVTELGSDGSITTVWFSGDKQQWSTFNQATLEPATTKRKQWYAEESPTGE